MSLLAPLLDWATQPGPPNWAFIAAILTAPYTWSRYVKQAATDLYQSRFATE